MVIAATCSCGSLLPEVTLCPDHHRYFRGGKQLNSVTKVIKGLWPIKPDFSRAKPEVLENARDRGCVVDDLFSAYVNGSLERIPRGTRDDAVQLFFKVRRWWDGRKHGDVRSQVILADDEIAGTCDVLDDDCIYDLKSTYNIEITYPIQLAAYAELHFATYQRPAKQLAIIHVTERFPEPKIIKIDLTETLRDWMTMREMWRLVQKRAGNRELENVNA